MTSKMGGASEKITEKGLVLWGCGKMGSALLQGWLKDGIPATSIWVNDPHPNDWVKGVQGLHLNAPLPKSPMVCVIAVKPQMMDKVLGELGKTGDADTIFLSIAAGVRICDFENAVNKNMGGNRAVIRAMPNTPAAIGAGISAVVCNKATSDTARDLADDLLSAVGAVIHLEGEDKMDAVTALSGSGPAYVFHLIEAMVAAGIAQGLPADTALTLARTTVAGAGALAQASDESPEQLRINVTSPAGTTEAALQVLMGADGLTPLMNRAIGAAAARSRELGEK